LQPKKDAAHILIKAAVVWSAIKAGEVQVHQIDNDNEIADTLTKALPPAKFLKLRQYLLN